MLPEMLRCTVIFNLILLLDYSVIGQETCVARMLKAHFLVLCLILTPFSVVLGNVHIVAGNQCDRGKSDSVDQL